MNPYYTAFYEGTSNQLSATKNKAELNRVCRTGHNELDRAFHVELVQSGSKIACCEGCFYCCHIKVDLLAGEAFVIADYIRTKFSNERQAAVLQRAKANWKRIEPMSYGEQFVSNIACPLLENGRCSVYPVRPGLCRIYHSTKVEPCKQSYEYPEMSGQPQQVVPNVQAATVNAIVATHKAFEDAGYDARAYDINGALVECFGNPHSEKRWRNGKSAFPKNMLAKAPKE